MAIVKNLLGSGIAGGAAQSITGRASLAQTASGATLGAQTIINDIVQYTSSTVNTGPTLPASAAPGDTYTIANASGNVIKVFPPTGGKINAGSANAATTQQALETATYIALGNGDWVNTAKSSAVNSVTHTPVSINSTATATAAQVASGYIKSTSAAATTITLPTGTLLGAAIGAVQGTILDLYIDNTAGASTITIAVAVNGILSALATSAADSFNVLTVPAGVTGLAKFTLIFSSATAYAFSRTA